MGKPSLLIKAIRFAALAIACGGCASSARAGQGLQQEAEGRALHWEEWQARCMAAPTNRGILTRNLPAGKGALTAGEFDALLDRYLALELQGNLSSGEKWVEDKPGERFFDPAAGWFEGTETPFQPFAQKLESSPGSRIVFHGDLHGDIRSLLTSLAGLQQRGLLDGFKLVHPDTHLVFLGDYTDRGHYGMEVVATLLQLKLDNPEQVWLTRGNHEDFQLINSYGFLSELRRKFGPRYHPRKVVRAFDCLPVVVYVGTPAGDFIQCNHGGLEPGYEPAPLLAHKGSVAYHRIGTLRQAAFAASHPEVFAGLGAPEQGLLRAGFEDFLPSSPTQPRTLGFMWNDFSVFSGDPGLAFNADRAWVYGRTGTAAVLAAQSTAGARIRAVFRAHQHSRNMTPLMQRLILSSGVFRHWQPADAAGLADASPQLLQRVLETAVSRQVQPGGVYTFNVSPDSVYGLGCGYGFTTHGILTLAADFDGWKLEVVALPVAADGSPEVNHPPARP